MHIISQLLEKRIVPVVIVAFLTILTLGTSVMGVTKVAGSYNQPDSLSESILDSEVLGSESSENNSNDEANSSGKTDSLPKTTNKTNSSNGNSANSVATTTNVNGTSNNTNPNACIITIFGKQYDVSSLRSTHPGGDVFVCGADQSAAYQGAHGASVSRLSQYLVTAGNSSNPGSSSQFNSGSDVNSHYDDDGDEDQEDDEEYENEDSHSEESED